MTNWLSQTGKTHVQAMANNLHCCWQKLKAFQSWFGHTDSWHSVDHNRTSFGIFVQLVRIWHHLEIKKNVYKKVLTSLDMFSQVWINLEKFRHVWTSLDKFRSLSNMVCPFCIGHNNSSSEIIKTKKKVWTRFGQVWTSLDKFEQAWTSLDKFEQVSQNKNYPCYVSSLFHRRRHQYWVFCWTI